MPSIPQLPAASSVSPTDQIPISQSDGTTRFATLAQISAGGVIGNLAGAGTTQATATPIPPQGTFTTAIFTAVASGTGALLDTALQASITVLNEGTNDLAVYPPLGAQFKAYGVNNPVLVPAGTGVTFVCQSATQWYVK